MNITNHQHQQPIYLLVEIWLSTKSLLEVFTHINSKMCIYFIPLTCQSEADLKAALNIL